MPLETGSEPIQDARPKPAEVVELLGRIENALEEEDFAESYRLYCEADHLIYTNNFTGASELGALWYPIAMGWELHGFIESIYNYLSRADWEGALSQLTGATQMFERRNFSFPITYNKIRTLETAINKILGSEEKRHPQYLRVKPVFDKRHNPSLYGSDVFVLMPFSEDLLPVYQDHIVPICSTLGISVSRADDFFTASTIITDIWHAIYKSQLVIADCTGRNPNVFYEIGLAHTVGRPTVLISQSMEDVPFDLKHIRCIIYKYTPRGMNKFNDTLRKTLIHELQILGKEIPDGDVT